MPLRYLTKSTKMAFVFNVTNIKYANKLRNNFSLKKN